MRAHIHLAPPHLSRLAYTPGGGASLMHGYRAGEFNKQATVAIPVLMTGEEAAEEMFDLTNNPSRQGEREQRYGYHRSVSVGDIIVVEEQPGLTTTWRCDSTGWTKIAF
jgi:hypothetical protein